MTHQYSGQSEKYTVTQSCIVVQKLTNPQTLFLTSNTIMEWWNLSKVHSCSGFQGGNAQGREEISACHAWITKQKQSD